MSFDKNYLENLADEIAFPELKFSDIPDIDLYMEQLISLIESKFRGFKRDGKDKVFTKTMINNYTKLGLLMPPENKKYTREHMILLTLIYNLKSILSINDIKLLFAPVLNDIARRDDDIMSLDDIYTAFLELNKIEFDSLYNSYVQKMDLIKEKTSGLEKDNKETAQLFLFIIMLVAHSSAQKRLAERLIDDFFTGIETQTD
ncbi:MAG: DUF1836 domain-containing protein [Syntrophomonas sp.]